MELSCHARATRLAHLYKALTQQHHRETTPVFRAVLAQDAVVIEAGGHAGQFTKLISAMLPNGQILTFEPGSYAYGILKSVVRWRCGQNTSVYNTALGAEEGSAELHVPIKKRGSIGFGLSHLGAETNPTHKTFVETIPQTTVDAVVESQRLSRVDLIKADIEGWELQMLKGAGKTLARFQPALFLEVNDTYLARAHDTSSDLWTFVSSFGYRGYIADDRNGTFCPVETGTTGDLWFFTAERAAAILR